MANCIAFYVKQKVWERVIDGAKVAERGGDETGLNWAELSTSTTAMFMCSYNIHAHTQTRNKINVIISRV